MYCHFWCWHVWPIKWFWSSRNIRNDIIIHSLPFFHKVMKLMVQMISSGFVEGVFHSLIGNRFTVYLHVAWCRTVLALTRTQTYQKSVHEMGLSGVPSMYNIQGVEKQWTFTLKMETFQWMSYLYIIPLIPVNFFLSIPNPSEHQFRFQCWLSSQNL